ncbi:NfrA family protein [Stenotrophomonas daejeonensis]|uniref:NfrA family protein n=1 Tax=Stenotrophomonas daejeonensis TaxID=659018 RepID=UPI0009FB7C34|nr:hypothetical protein [Stenotrophomonas daejeonensis]
MRASTLSTVIALALAMATPVLAAEELPLTGTAYRIAEEAYAAYARGDYARATEQAREAVRLRPDVARLHDLLRSAEAARAASASGASGKQSLPAAKTPAQLREERAWQAADGAYKAYNEGRFADAEQGARQSLRLQADNAAMHVLLVHALDKQDQLREAATAAEQGVAGFPDDESLLALRDRLHRRMAAGPANAAWAMLQRKDYDGAAAAAGEAVGYAPDIPSYWYLQVGALLMQGRDADADAVASRALEQDGQDAFALILRAYARARGHDMAAARADMELAQRQDWLSEQEAGRIRLVAQDIAGGGIAKGSPEVFCTGEQEDMRCSVEPAGSSTNLAGPGYEAATAFYAAQARRDFAAAATHARQALAADGGNTAYRVMLADALAMSGQAGPARTELAALSAHGALADEQLLAAAYAAQRANENALASSWFRQAVDAIDAGRLQEGAEARRNITGVVSDLERTWGFNAALGFGTVGVMSPAFAPSLSARRALQSSEELYWRPPGIGNRNGTRVELFVRMGQTLYDGTGGATGAGTNQVVVGARWKPLRQQNVVLGLEHFVDAGQYARRDWLARVAWSDGNGGSFRDDARSWGYWNAYAEADRFLESSQTLGTLNLAVGRAYRLDRFCTNCVGIVHVSANVDYDSELARKATLGAGPGVSLRRWFRGDTYHSPRSSIELNLQYRVRLAGDDRSRGVFAGLYFSY